MSEYTGTDNLEVMKEAKNYNQYLFDLIKNNTNKDANILDFGAGIGTFAELMKREKYDISCIESDIKQANIIKSLNIPALLDINDLEDNSFDFIYTLNVLEHIENDNEILSKLKQKLKPNGKILIYLPAFNCLYSSMDKKVGHYRRYDFEMLKILAKQNGLIREKLYYVDSLGFLITLLYKLIGNKEGNINKSSLIFYDKVIFPVSCFCDYLFNKIFGKNVYMVLKKKDEFKNHQ